MKEKKRGVVFMLLFMSMFAFGMVENYKGVSYPLIKTEFNTTWEQQGLLVSMLSMSYVAFSIAAGILLKRFGIKFSFIMGKAAVAIGCIAVFFSPGFLTVSASLLLIFAGHGYCEVGINALASRVFSQKTAMLMNLLHAFYGIGAIAGPIFAGYITGKAGFNWRVPYLWSLPLCAGLFIAAIFTKFPENKNMADNARDRVPGKSFFDALQNPHVWLISVTIGLGVTVEAISPNWGLLYFQDIFGIDPRIRGAALLSGFFICFTASRLLCSILVEKIDYMNFLIFAAFSIIATYTAIYLLGANGIFLLPVLGLFIGPLWPTTMAVSIRHFGKDAPIMTSAIISLGSAVNAGVQYLIGLTNRLFGAAWGYRSGLLYSLIYILLLVILKKTIKKSRAKDVRAQTAIEN